MKRRLPSLNALRAFEAVARHLSMTKAAEELNVTPAAVSRQVKTLEDYLGVTLFRRANKALFLTDAGQACLPALTRGFDLLAAAIRDLGIHDARRPLTVSVTPSFGAQWLVPGSIASGLSTPPSTCASTPPPGSSTSGTTTWTSRSGTAREGGRGSGRCG